MTRKKIIKHSLKSITIKPTLSCNAACSFCEQRMDHYKKSTVKDNLTLDQWRKIINESIQLGAKQINISGGEPTLYPYLFDLIEYCKSKGVEVHLKSNGYLIDKKFADRLLNLNLDSCTISIYSHKSSAHDKLKRLKGSHKAAVNAIRYLTDNGVTTNIQVILNPDLIINFDKYLKWVSNFKINVLFLSYLEGGQSLKHPTAKEISYFFNVIKPKCKNYLSLFQGDGKILNENLSELDGLFYSKDIPLQKIAAGIYNLKKFKHCGRNSSMAMILGNGEIHPCNAVEYFHKPIVGDLYKQSLIQAWSSDKWKKVRLFGLNYCHLCPMNRHTLIKFTDGKIPPFYSSPSMQCQN